MTLVEEDAFARAAGVPAHDVWWDLVLQWALAAGYVPLREGERVTGVFAADVRSVVAEWRMVGCPGLLDPVDGLAGPLLPGVR